jgi:hypothetical protein
MTVVHEAEEKLRGTLMKVINACIKERTVEPRIVAEVVMDLATGLMKEWGTPISPERPDDEFPTVDDL